MYKNDIYIYVYYCLFTSRIIMVESPNFYAAYGPVLAALQTYKIKDLPIKDTIVRYNDIKKHET